MSLTLTAPALRPWSKGSEWHACGRRHCACRACMDDFSSYFRLPAYRLYSKITAAKVPHRYRRCLNGKYSRRCWKKYPRRTRLCRELEHPVVVNATRYEECVANRREPLPLASNCPADPSDRV